MSRIAPSLCQTGSALEGKISIAIALGILRYPQADMQLYANMDALEETEGK